MHSLKLATESDWPDILRMARRFHDVSPYRAYTFDENKVRTIFNKYLSDPEEIIIIVGCSEDQKVACLCAGITELYFSPLRVASELIWWVDEDYRNSRLGIDLFKAFEFWAKKLRVDILQATQTTETTDLVKFYTRNGYHLAESTFIKELN